MMIDNDEDDGHLPPLLVKPISVPVRVDTPQLLHHPVVLSAIVGNNKNKTKEKKYNDNNHPY